MPFEDVLLDLEEQGAERLGASQLSRLNDAVFNLVEEEEASSGIALRLFQLTRSLRELHGAGRLGQAEREYVALLGTLQNQFFFTAEQSDSLRSWICEALARDSSRRAGEEANAARSDGADRAEKAQLRRLRERQEALRSELETLYALQEAVSAFVNFKPRLRSRHREEDAGDYHEYDEDHCDHEGEEQEVEEEDASEEEEEEEEDSDERRRDRRRQKKKKKGKRRLRNSETFWQVQVENDWVDYDDEAQRVIRAAVEAGELSCQVSANGQMYDIDLDRCLQINQQTRTERPVRSERRRRSRASGRTGWQVQTGDGWHFYSEEAQRVIRGAAEKGQSSCEIFANGRYYRIDLEKNVQVNTETGNERTVRLVGSAPAAPQMPKLNFKRLMAEFRQMESIVASGQEPSFLRCEPVEDNLMEWEVDLRFPEDSKLQVSLRNLAESMLDSSLDRVTLCLRFPVEYPLSPPEVWLRRPRMTHRSGPVTFGGRICTMLLATAGWLPGNSMLVVLKEVQQSLVEEDVEACLALATKKEYAKASVQLDRLNSELFPTANDFCVDGMTALSATEASAFLGDLGRMEATDKIGLPFAYANKIYSRAEQGAELELPMIFEVKTLLGRKTHCAIFEFLDGLPDMHVLLPKWVMEDLDIQEREPVRVRGVALDLITCVKVQPHSVDFYQAVRESGREVPDLLQDSLARFSALTEDTKVPVEIGGKHFEVQIVKLEPQGAVRIIDMDVQHHFEFKVEFEPAPDLEDEVATREYQERALNAVKLRRERSEAGRQEMAERRAEARRCRFEDLTEEVRKAAGVKKEEEGSIETSLRLPDGTKVSARFEHGAPVEALMVLALESKWAEAALPWGIYLRMSFPNRLLRAGDSITEDFHRAAINVQEEQAPEKDEELFAVLSKNGKQHHRRGELVREEPPDVPAPPPIPEQKEDELFARTQRAFEMQRYLRAGYDLQEAAERYEAGEVLPPTEASRKPAPKPPRVRQDQAAATAPAPTLQRTKSEQEERESRVQDVMGFTGADRATAEAALEASDWVTDMAVNSVLDNLVADDT
eukprot:TRINITY_DN75628_c0_g1_i1.p1 TRINITY_DN75628_c0_g1~~TRINITY_DN75628_c0_g1_i1.p1  ORF type:complete len:1054 (-),score=261.82 TRINITY_DN75628_c0_g1_i1:63-3224(-)